MADPRSTGHELLQESLVALSSDLRRLDPLVRADVPDAVHQMRIACRRLRGILGTFAKSFDREETEPVRNDLRWLIRELGQARDLEVQRVRFGTLLAAEPPELVRGDIRRWIDTQLRAAHRTAQLGGARAMESDRYAGLVDTLTSWSGTPPWSTRKDRPARTVLVRAVRREWRRLEQAVSAAEAAEGTPEHVNRLHDVRKAAKHVRYAAETLAPVVGPDARRLASAMAGVQDALGEHHDTAVAGDHLLALADAARAADHDTFTYGVLRSSLDADLEATERAYARAWRRAGKPKLRRWLS